ncbi:hypothetical protein PV326_010173 [Microctonus aethiopoides]|nr:hypothetical protein PV326_010173 [Microctonus aethiopoides]
MLLTLFYMVSTWMQALKLSSLKARLSTALSCDPKPSIMFYIKPPASENDVGKDINASGICENLLSSHLCSNKNEAKLMDLVWCQGDKRLCVIHPQQIIDVNNWLLYPYGKTYFPLIMNNHGRAKLNDETQIHVLIEADIEHFNPNAFTKITKLEEYGLLVSWTANKSFAAIMETDVDHMSKLSIALMHNQCFINNGLLLTRIESIEVTGKPCSYNLNNSTSLEDKKLVGKAQWKSHMDKLKLFSKTAWDISQSGKSLEVDGFPGIIMSPGSKTLTLSMPIILQIDSHCEYNDIDEDKSLFKSSSSVPSTPPPTPASATIISDNAGSSQLPTNFNILEASFNKHTTATVSTDESLKTFSYTNIPENNTLNNLNTKSSGEITHINRTSKYSPAKKPTSIIYSSAKPPNVLIYSDSAATRDNIKCVLKQTLNQDKYVIYTLTSNEARRDVWTEQTNLLVVCGNVDSEIAAQLVNYIVNGGQLLALCSDALHILLPSFKTAEVREHELVRFSYGRWKNVQMMHHIFCYQASPIKTRFSQDHEDVKTITPQTPHSAHVKDKNGKVHTFQIKVLGKEETWQTPSIVLADLPSSGGRAVFSQIHLEADPSQYEIEETKLCALKDSNNARLEILSDLLSSHLGMDVKPQTYTEPAFNPGFFLGRHELKLEMLERLKSEIKENDILETPHLKLQFCGNTTKLHPASPTCLPIMLHHCPDNFSTIEYFENLSTNELGRLVIYADVITSSMDVVNGVKMHHGLVVLPRQQTQGRGRNKNKWLSPKGCAMFTMQLHISMQSYIGQHLPILQHIVGVAVIRAVRTSPGYEDIDLRLKWPNDIYLGEKIKIGGLIVTTFVKLRESICNIGVGVNLANDLPSCCINDIIIKYNEQHGTKLSKLSYERFFALVFNSLEYLLDIIENGDIDQFYQLYYDYWLHTDAKVNIELDNGRMEEVKILGIDSYGFLEVQGQNGNIFTVQPDGNSFDIFKGLITPSAQR